MANETERQQQDQQAPDIAEQQTPPAPETQPRPEAGAAVSEEEQHQTSEAGYQLNVPADVPAVTAEEQRPALDEFAAAASAAGIEHPVAQAMVEAFVDADSAMDYRGDLDADGAEAYLRSHWREKFTEKIASVHKTVKALGPAFAEYLDRSNLGNSPAVLQVLADFGLFRMAKAEAQAELQKIKGDFKSDYFSQDHWRRIPAVLKVKILSRIAHAEDAPVTDPRARAMSASENSRLASAVKSQADARKEASELLRSGKLEKGTEAERTAARQRWHHLLAVITK